MHSFIAIVPARAASARLPGKMLLDLNGLPLVVRTAQQAAASKASRLIVATDDEKIAQTVQKYGFEIVMTSPEHPSGTDRLAEVAQRMNLDDEQIIVNVQGDEPLIDPDLINQVAQVLIQQPSASIATCACPIQSSETLFNPNAVKVVCDLQGRALYFSRAPIPWARDDFAKDKSLLPKDYFALHHIGLYAYRVKFLKQYPQLSPGRYEQLEALEQLRAIEYGYSIHVLVTPTAPFAGVDTQEDLERVRKFLATQA